MSWLWIIPGEVWTALGGLIALFAAVWGIKRAGRKEAQADHRAEKAEDYIDTRTRIDHGTGDAGTGTDDDIRKRLRERGKR